MSNIVGTVITVKSFISTSEAKIPLAAINEMENHSFILAEKRKYVIPDFQRELRWSKENIIELMRDLSSGKIFLGNIILTHEYGSKKFEVIDGQQRLTAIKMLITYIRKKYSDEIESLYTVCDIDNKTFSQSDQFINRSCCLDSYSDDEKEKLKQSDKLGQYETFVELWNAIDKSDMLNGSGKAEKILDNLERSEINIVCFKDEDTGEGINYYLDVNLKGIKLDDEDIFKGYLFRRIKNSTMREKWSKLSTLSKRVNNNGKKYPLTKLLEHLMYCELSKEEEYAEIAFNEKFKIKQKVELNNEIFYQGEHILKVISKISVITRIIDNAIDFYEFVQDIINTTGASQSFKDRFKNNKGKMLSDVTIQIFHGYLKNIMFGNLILQKAIILKYFCDVLKKHTKTDTEMEKLFNIYLYNTMFMLFEGGKKIETIKDILVSDEWDELLLTKIDKILKNENIYDSQRKALYNFTVTDIKGKDEEQKYMCKILASVYNFFTLQNGKIEVEKDDLLEYLTSKKNVTVEHFVVANSGLISVNVKGKTINHPVSEEIKIYSKNIFNFLFIPKKINEGIDTKFFLEKISVLYKDVKKYEKITCNYTKEALKQADQLFECENMESQYTFKNIKDIDMYLNEKFKTQYDEYSKKIIGMFVNKFKQ